MMQRKLRFGSAVAVVNLALGVALAGCGNSPVGTTTGGAGTSGQAGTTANGGAGTGAAGTESGGGAGTSNGAAGTESSTGAAGVTAAAGASGGGAGTGAAGTSAAAGTSGAAGKGAAGTSGAAGTAGGGAGTGGGRPSGPSAGCNADVPPDPIGKATVHNLTVTVSDAFKAMYTSRKFYTTLPMAYAPDPAKPYPVVFWGPGCGATGPEGSSFTTGHFLKDIFYVELLSVTGCFEAGKQGAADSPDGPYFDMALAEVEKSYCVDKGKVFAAGTSSGAWLSNYLACARGNVIRGAAADSGGLQHDHGTCTGGAAVMEMPGDSTSTIVNTFDIGSGPARDMFIKLNGCSMTPTTMAFGNAKTCQVYGGCASPVVWCNVGGAHQSGNNVIAESAWAFWSTLQ